MDNEEQSDNNNSICGSTEVLKDPDFAEWEMDNSINKTKWYEIL